MRIVLDTNILMVSISERSKHHWVYKSFLEGKYELAITTSILNEYEENRYITFFLCCGQQGLLLDNFCNKVGSSDFVQI